MKLLIDTNVLLDVLLKREPFYEESAKVLTLSGKENVYEFVSASAITDIYYIAYRSLKDRKMVRELLKKLLSVVSVATVAEEEIKYALSLEWTDFEDSVQYSVAALSEMDGVVTRNSDDYNKSTLPIWAPGEILKMNL